MRPLAKQGPWGLCVFQKHELHAVGMEIHYCPGTETAGIGDNESAAGFSRPAGLAHVGRFPELLNTFRIGWIAAIWRDEVSRRPAAAWIRATHARRVAA